MAKKTFWRRAVEALAQGIWWLLRKAAWLVGTAAKAIYTTLQAIFTSATQQAAKATASKPQFAPLLDVEAQSGSAAQLEDWLYSSPSTIGIILGARGSGKSALGMRLLENAAAKGKRVYAMGFDSARLPAWINKTQTLEVANDSLLLVDEGGITFSSRSSFSNPNKLLSALLLVARHKSLSVIFITQNSANLEVNSLRQADYLILKKPSLLQKDFERKKITEIIEQTKQGFCRHESKEVFYAYSDVLRGFASAQLPSFWTESTSKAFAQSKIGKL